MKKKYMKKKYLNDAGDSSISTYTNLDNKNTKVLEEKIKINAGEESISAAENNLEDKKAADLGQQITNNTGENPTSTVDTNLDDNKNKKTKDLEEQIKNIEVKKLILNYKITSDDINETANLDRQLDTITQKTLYIGGSVVKTLLRIFQIVYNTVIRDTNKIKIELINAVKRLQNLDIIFINGKPTNDKIEKLGEIVRICNLILKVTEFYKYGDIAKLLKEFQFFSNNDQNAGLIQQAFSDKSEYFSYLTKSTHDSDENIPTELSAEEIRKIKEEVEKAVEKEFKEQEPVDATKKGFFNKNKAKEKEREREKAKRIKEAEEKLLKEKIKNQEEVRDAKKNKGLFYLYIAFLFNILLLNVVAVLLLKQIGITFPYDIIMFIAKMGKSLVFSGGSIVGNVANSSASSLKKQNVPPDISTMILQQVFKLIIS